MEPMKLMFNFIWDNKPDKIKREILLHKIMKKVD